MYKKLNFKKYSDGRGDLVPLEFGTDKYDIPFDVKRCYFITAPTNEADAIRGKHAHKNLEQVMIAMHGSFTLKLDDGKGNIEEIKLSKNSEGIYFKDLIWREFYDFSDDCEILVLASDYYNPEDYVHDYDEFLSLVKEDKLKDVA